MAFTHKQLAVTFDLGSGTFGESGANRVKLGGPLRASAMIVATGGPSFTTLDLAIHGMTLSNMARFSTLGMLTTQLRRNVVTVEAGDTAGGLGLVYQGQIINAWADFAAMPNNVFHVQGGAGALEAVKPIPPTSYRGLVDVATIMKSLAAQAVPPLTFSNDGVSSRLIDCYFPGTIYEQIQRCATAANINWIIDRNELAIWPKDGVRGKLVPVISRDTGMINYPTFTANGLLVTVTYTPSISFGQKIKVTSDITPACGEWQIQTLVHHLESETPGGQWYSRFEAVPPGFFASSH